MDNELFELCKEVYERLPDWKTEDVYIDTHGDIEMVNKDHWETVDGEWGSCREIVEKLSDEPFYEVLIQAYSFTSDYLLEKLHGILFKGNRKTVSLIFEEDGTYSVDADDIYKGPRLNVENGDTPLKALLKLVIALDDVKELTK